MLLCFLSSVLYLFNYTKLLEKLFSLKKLLEKSVEKHGIDNDQECFSFWPMENQATVKDHMRVLENGDKADGSLITTLRVDYPLVELLTSPCIVFAIQALTGVTLYAYKNSHCF